MDPKNNLQFKTLVKKTVMLFKKLGTHRKQAMFTSSICDIIFKEKKVILLPIKTMKRRYCDLSGVFIINLEYSSSVSIVNFEHVIDGSDAHSIYVPCSGGRYHKMIKKYNIPGGLYNRMIHKYNIPLTLLLIGYAQLESSLYNSRSTGEEIRSLRKNSERSDENP